jgi:two-component system KDP operon response regulator KdpE
MHNSLLSACFLVSSDNTWLTEIDSLFSQSLLLDHAGQLFPTMRETWHDLIILQDSLFENDIYPVISELKSRFPIVQIVVLQSKPSKESAQSLIDAGASDVISLHYPFEIIAERLQLLSRISLQTNTLHHHSRQLHALSRFSQTLYQAASPEEILSDTIIHLITQLGFQGVSFMLEVEDSLQIYSGTANSSGSIPIFQGAATFENYHPVLQAFTTGTTFIYEDIRTHPSYQPIPGIENPSAALLIPLKQAAYTVGVMAIFSAGKKFSSDDLATFEMFTTHLVTAYSNVIFHRERELDLYSKRQLVNVWQKLSSVSSIDKANETLIGFIATLDKVGNAAAFVIDPGDQNLHVASKDPRMTRLLQVLHERNHINEILSEVDEGMHAIIYNRRQRLNTPLHDLFALMASTQFAIVPIGDSMLLGGLLVAPSGNHAITQQELSLMERFAHATARTIERNLIIDEVNLQRGRLESLLLSVHEAVFFVDESGTVTFCNPQFSELTGISIARVIGASCTDLFSELARQTSQPEDVRIQLESARDQITATTQTEDEHPIIELTLDHSANTIILEFMKSSLFDTVRGWTGLIRPMQGVRSSNKSMPETSFISTLLEVMAATLIRLHSTSAVLAEQYHTMRQGSYLNLIQQLRKNLLDAQIMWQNLLEIYQYENNNHQLDMENIELGTLVENGVQSGWFQSIPRQIQLQVEPPLVQVQVNQDAVLRALKHILLFFTNLSDQPSTPLSVRIKPDSEFVTVTVQDKGIILPESQRESLFDLEEHSGSDKPGYSDKLGLYISRRLLLDHGGRLQVESHQTWGLAVKLLIPLPDNRIQEISTAPSAKIPARSELTIVVVSSSARILKEFYSILDAEGFRLYVEDRMEAALSNLELTYTDLIIVENTPGTHDIVKRTKAIRSKTSVPLLIVSPAEAEDDCLKALSSGADAYVLLPLSTQKLLAQIQSVAQRKSIGARTTPPMQVGDLYIDLSAHRVYLGNKLLDLTAKEYEILHVLAANRGQVLTHEQILTQIWGPEYRNETQYLWVNMSRLRRKIEPTKSSRRYIYTEKSVGYIMHED